MDATGEDRWSRSAVGEFHRRRRKQPPRGQRSGPTEESKVTVGELQLRKVKRLRFLVPRRSGVRALQVSQSEGGAAAVTAAAAAAQPEMFPCWGQNTCTVLAAPHFREKGVGRACLRSALTQQALRLLR